MTGRAKNLLVIPRGLLRELHRHAADAAPREACGILSGAGGRAEVFHPVRNVEASEVTYRMDPDEQYAVLTEVERTGKRVVAICHSHPASPAVPSPTDIEQAFFPGSRDPNYPGVAYVITSLAGPRPETRAFLIETSGVEEIPVMTD